MSASPVHAAQIGPGERLAQRGLRSRVSVGILVAVLAAACSGTQPTRSKRSTSPTRPELVWVVSRCSVRDVRSIFVNSKSVIIEGTVENRGDATAHGARGHIQVVSSGIVLKEALVFPAAPLRPQVTTTWNATTLIPADRSDGGVLCRPVGRGTSLNGTPG